LIGKNIDDVDIIACFSFDARRVWQGSHRDFNEFVKEAKVDEKKKFDILKNELMELNTNAAVIIGKYVAFEQVRGKIKTY